MGNKLSTAGAQAARLTANEISATRLVKPPAATAPDPGPSMNGLNDLLCDCHAAIDEVASILSSAHERLLGHLPEVSGQTRDSPISGKLPGLIACTYHLRQKLSALHALAYGLNNAV